MWKTGWLSLMILATGACSGELNAPLADNPSSSAPVCTPGHQIECACLAGAKGLQTCSADGTSYHECRCADATPAGSILSDSATAPPDVTPEGALANESSTDVNDAQRSDSSPTDAPVDTANVSDGQAHPDASHLEASTVLETSVSLDVGVILETSDAPDASPDSPLSSDSGRDGSSCSACDDGNLCTVDSCSDGTVCEHRPVSFDDHNGCTIDGCDPATGVHHKSVIVDDGNACTTDLYNPVTGNMSHNLVAIDDHNACTTTKNCSAICSSVDAPTSSGLKPAKATLTFLTNPSPYGPASGTVSVVMATRALPAHSPVSYALAAASCAISVALPLTRSLSASKRWRITCPSANGF